MAVVTNFDFLQPRTAFGLLRREMKGLIVLLFEILASSAGKVAQMSPVSPTCQQARTIIRLVYERKDIRDKNMSSIPSPSNIKPGKYVLGLALPNIFN